MISRAPATTTPRARAACTDFTISASPIARSRPKETQVFVTINDLVSGKIWDRPGAKQNPANIAILQTLALVQKILEEESERTTITHEGTRQLLAASGVLPRSVQAPDWVQYGLAG